MLAEKGVPSAVIWTVRRWCLDRWTIWSLPSKNICAHTYYN